MGEPDWENFAKAVLTDWPTGDLDGSVLFDLSLQYGMIQEVPGGYNSDHHFDAEGICPEEGDPWYEYTFRGEAGPGLYSTIDMNKRIEELEAKLGKSVLVEYDNGDVISLSSFAGGASEGGEWSSLTLMKEEPDGTTSFREYKAFTDWHTTLADLTGGKDE